MITTRTVIKPKQQLGKYRIECKLGEGGCAAVYRALDTIEGVRVALKVPFQNRINDSWLNEFKREIRINAQLHHPNILPVKNAEILEGLPMVAYPLGERTLADRLRSRISVETSVHVIDQLLDAVAALLARIALKQAVPDYQGDELHDAERLAFLRAHLGASLDAIEQGVDLHGYFYWSLMDNYEWSWGYDKRFGIVRVDYDTQQRTVKDSGAEYARIIAARAL